MVVVKPFTTAGGCPDILRFCLGGSTGQRNYQLQQYSGATSLSSAEPRWHVREILLWLPSLRAVSRRLMSAGISSQESWMPSPSEASRRNVQSPGLAAMRVRIGTSAGWP
jgi:hypothetical protein